MLVRKLGTRSTKNNLRCIEVADFQIPRILNNVAEGRGGRIPSIRSFVPRIACRRTVARPTVNHRRYIVYGWKYLRNIGIHGQRATFLAILKSVDHETVEIRTDTNFKTENIQSVYE